MSMNRAWLVEVHDLTEKDILLSILGHTQENGLRKFTEEEFKDFAKNIFDVTGGRARDVARLMHDLPNLHGVLLYREPINI